MSTLLTFNLTTKQLLDGATPWQPPTLTFGESLTLGLTFEEDTSGTTLPASPIVTALSAAIGYIDTPPAGGTTCLQIGSGASTSANTTPPFPWNVGPVSLQMAINALTAVTGVYGQSVVSETQGSLLIKFPSYAGQPPLQIRNNTLFPVSFGTFNAWQLNGAWVQELRFMQAPLAFTSASSTVLPPAPSVTEIQEGGSGGGASWDEIQSLYVPPSFAGTYYLKLGSARTVALDKTDGAPQVQAALQAIAPAGGIFTVTNPTSYTGNIDFGGTMAGSSYALLEPIVESAPPGNLTFTLNLSMGEMWAALRASGTTQITAPMQVTLGVQDPITSEVSNVIIYLPAITVQKSAIFAELGEVPAIDWINPPSPVDYVPFNPDQVITGQQYFQAVVGDGTSTVFVISHGLDTEVVFTFGRINASGGRQLVNGTDFSAVITNANEVTVTALTGAPTTNNWAIYVMSAQTVAAFASGLTLTIAQVTGLQAVLDSIGTELAAISALLPTAPPAIAPASGSTLAITIPTISEMLPGTVPSTNSGISPTGKLPRPGALYPCVNSTAGSIPNGTFPLAAPTPGTTAIFKNNSGVTQLIDGGLGHRSAMLAAAGYVATDGRGYFVANQAGSTNSFFPADMERTLFSFDINSAMLVAGSTLTLTFNLLLQMLQANVRAQYMVVIEEGSTPEDTSPSPVATNLQNVIWNTASPVLAQQVILTPVAVTHLFGMSVSLGSNGSTLTAQRNLYGVWTGGAQTPSSPSFAIRARLIQFDTEDSVVNPMGTVYYAVSNGSASIAT